jgi:glycosyltransferase involved in cell wall biosynthesis
LEGALAVTHRKSVRILLAYNSPAARTGGMSRIMAFTHDYVAAAGHEVEYFRADDVPRHWQGRRARLAFPWAARRRAVQAAREGRPYDIINIHEPSAALLVSSKKAAGNPFIVVMSHGVMQRGWELELEEKSLGREGPSWKTRLIYPLTALTQARWALRRADHVICLNRQDRAYLQEKMGITPTHVQPGAATIYAEHQRDYARAETLLFAGTWIPRKGSRDLVVAFARLAEIHPRLRLVILGGGAPPETILAAFPAALRGRAQCVQTANEKETAAAFANADIYLLPSLFEGTPLTLIEAMMSGLPVVTTETCGMADVITDGKNGLLVPLRAPERIVQAVGSLLESEDLRKRLGRAAQADALAKHTWEQAAQPFLQLYERRARGEI